MLLIIAIVQYLRNFISAYHCIALSLLCHLLSASAILDSSRNKNVRPNRGMARDLLVVTSSILHFVFLGLQLPVLALPGWCRSCRPPPVGCLISKKQEWFNAQKLAGLIWRSGNLYQAILIWLWEVMIIHAIIFGKKENARSDNENQEETENERNRPLLTACLYIIPIIIVSTVLLEFNVIWLYSVSDNKGWGWGYGQLLALATGALTICSRLKSYFYR